MPNMLVALSSNNITNLIVYYPQWGAPYPADEILHGEQIKIQVSHLILMLQFCHGVNMGVIHYNKLIGQRLSVMILF